MHNLACGMTISPIRLALNAWFASSCIVLLTSTFFILNHSSYADLAPFGGAHPGSLDISVQPANRVFRGDLHEAPVRDHLKPTKTIINAVTDTVYHKMEVDGTAKICFKAPRHVQAKEGFFAKDKIFRFALRITTVEELPDKAKPNANVGDHLTHMEMEMKKIKRNAKNKTKNKT